MFDVTFLIPDYPEPSWDFMPNPPDDEMPDWEKERLFDELCAWIDAGAFDPEREIIVG